MTSDERRAALERAARALDIELDIVEARTPDDFAAAMRRPHDAGASAVNILASPLFSTEANRVAAAAIDGPN